MYLYVASPTRTTEVTEDHPLFKVTVADKVCADLPYKVTMFGDNRWTSLLTIDMTDDEFDALVDMLADARFKRLQQQQATYEALQEKFAPKVEWDNTPVEFEPRCGEGVHRFSDGVCIDCGDGIDGTLDGE